MIVRQTRPEDAAAVNALFAVAFESTPEHGPAQAEVLFTRIRRQLGAVSLAPETGETLHDWGERLDKLFPAKYVDPPVLAMERWYYGEIPPEPEDVAALARLSARLEREVRGILGTRQWFRQRVLGIK